MACETCVEMTPLVESLMQEMMRLKRTNKVMRTVNSLLRRHQQRLQAGADGLFLAVCEIDKSAEFAFRELWNSGEFDCGPQDYPTIVKTCLAAVRECNDAAAP